MGRQRTPVHELQKVRQRLLELRRVLEHVVGDAGEADDLRRQAAVGVDKGLEPLADLSIAQHNGADLRDSLPVHLEAGGLDVKAHELPVQRAVQIAVDHHPVVDVVDEVPLHTVEELDLVPGGVPGVREGLGHAVVRDGDGRVAPADGGLHRLLGIRQGVHVAHLGVQVQLHPLLLCGVLPEGVVDDADVIGVELDVLSIPGGLHLALDHQPHARRDSALQLLGLLGGEVFLDGDRVGVIRHVKAHAPHAGPPGLPALKGKDLTGHGGIAHLQIQVPHGAGPGLDGLAHQDLGGLDASPLLLPAGGGCGMGRCAGGSRSPCGQLPRHLYVYFLKAVHAHQQPLELGQGVLPQLRPGSQMQRDGHVGLIDAGAGQHSPRQLQPQLAGKLQFCEHFKKWDVS
ncbi:unknown [Oscillibacter sp. CAG:155]|nr:unknown [Oscillibacter sp. CAG:155]